MTNIIISHACFLPDLFVEPPRITKEEGSDYTFVCHSPGTDPNWYMKLNDTYSLKLVTDTKYEVFVHINTDNDSSMGYLRIKNAVPEDSGTYQCIQGTSSFNVLLEIYSGNSGFRIQVIDSPPPPPPPHFASECLKIRLW